MIYEERGLVVPEARTEGRFRLYTERQDDRLFPYPFRIGPSSNRGT